MYGFYLASRSLNPEQVGVKLPSGTVVDHLKSERCTIGDRMTNTAATAAPRSTRVYYRAAEGVSENYHLPMLQEKSKFSDNRNRQSTIYSHADLAWGPVLPYFHPLLFLLKPFI